MDDRQIREKLGALLKAERERQQIALADLGEQLKISEAHLECIEQGDVTGLPSELYFSLFAKSYAQSIGIDYTRTLEAIKAELLEQASPIRKHGKASRPVAEGDEEAEEAESSNVKTIAWIGGAIVGAFAIFIVLNTFVFQGDSETSPGATTEEPPAGQVIDDAAYAAYDWKAPKASQAPEPLKLSLLARDDVWTTVFSDGDTALRQTLAAGRSYAIEAEHRLQLWIAAPSRVSLTLNGESIDARDPRTNRVSGVEINQLNKDKFMAGERVAAGTERPTSATAPNPPPPSPPAETTTETETQPNDTTGTVDRADTDAGEQQ